MSQVLLLPAQGGEHYTDQCRSVIFPCKLCLLGSPSCVIHVLRAASSTRGNLSGLKEQCLAITRTKYSIVLERIVRAVLQFQKPVQKTEKCNISCALDNSKETPPKFLRTYNCHLMSNETTLRCN